MQNSNCSEKISQNGNREGDDDEREKITVGDKNKTQKQ